ncbi:uncharacterized protein LOC143280836 isoform X1 [Babylonia areolata]|uniref:uncharacterized protein LOC143280836 isoform X1 n=1 Tax=Babylonia areolata TaxID=304850 RepID=UPI003FCF01FA
MESAKRVKKPNFSDEETALMLEEISTEAACLLSAFQTGVTVKKKKEIWDRITDKVNAIGGNGRTQEQIKKKLKDLKSSVLRKKQEASRTGGGAPTPSIPFEDIVMGILGSNTNLTSGISQDETTDTWDSQRTSSPTSSHSTLESQWSSHTSQSVPVMGPSQDFDFPAGTTFHTLDLAIPSTPQRDRPTSSTVTFEMQLPHPPSPSTVTPSSAAVMPTPVNVMPIQERPASTPPRLQSTSTRRSKKGGSKRSLFHPEAEQAETEDEGEKLWKDFLRSEIQKNKLKMQLMEEQLRQLRDQTGN